MELMVETDGSSKGLIRVLVDESGGTSEDYDYALQAPPEWPSNTHLFDIVSLLIPPGGSYMIENSVDPYNGNTIWDHREFLL
jgi:hypothetical protein